MRAKLGSVWGLPREVRDQSQLFTARAFSSSLVAFSPPSQLLSARHLPHWETRHAKILLFLVYWDDLRCHGQHAIPDAVRTACRK